MLFEVSRTSVSEYGDKPPCDGARQMKVNDLDSVWVIEIESLAELMEFCGKHGDVVLRDGMTGWRHLEIYDDNRE